MEHQRRLETFPHLVHQHAAVQRFEINIEQRHLDATSISVEGEYRTFAEARSEAIPDLELQSEVPDEPTPIRLARGYLRDHRPDLKQFLMTLVCAADGGVPLWLSSWGTC